LGITYKDAGVDVEAGNRAVRLMKQYVEKTFDGNVLSGLGAFGGMYQLDDGNVLVAGTDGVGTKLKAAFELNRHDTVGIDCVAMCANDIVCHGAKPLFFLDYISTGKLDPPAAAEIVKGVARGCREAGCALIGGETAEMPGFYQEDEYDIAGFAVGMVRREKLITGDHIKKGDVLIGLASSGIHSNGFSLVRKVVSMNKETLNRHIDTLGEPLGDALLKPTRIYVKTVLALTERFEIKGIAHITGGGFIENIPRILPERLRAKIDLNTFERPPIFDLLTTQAQMDIQSAYNTFNMGIGMVLAVDSADVQDVITAADGLGEKAYAIGEVVAGKAGVTLCGG